MPNPPVPTAIRRARGTERADRANPDEPMAARLEAGDQPPSWLVGPRRRRAYADLIEVFGAARILTILDRLSLVLLVDAFGDYLEATDLIRGRACAECGRRIHQPDELCAHPSRGRRYYSSRTLKTVDGEEFVSTIIRPHPAVSARKDAWDRVVTLLGKFGGNPSDRTRIRAVADVEHDPMEEILDRSRTA